MSKKLDNIIIHRGSKLYATAISGVWNKSKKELELEGVKIVADCCDPVDFLPDSQLKTIRFTVYCELANSSDNLSMTINNLALIGVSGNWKVGSGKFELKGKTVSRSARNLGGARSAGPKGMSLHIGVNVADPDHYGTDIRLNGCVNDSIDMRQLAARAGFSSRAFTDDQATRDNVKNAISDAATQLNSGDLFLLTYAGHGSQIVDTTNTEADGFNETWCLYDGMLIDNELYDLWTQFKPGVRVLVLSDSCHSGTMSRRLGEVDVSTMLRSQGVVPRSLDIARSMIIYNDHLDFYENIMQDLVARNVHEQTVNAHVRLISGCQDNQLSYENGGSGAFTVRLKEVWNFGRFSGNYNDFAQQIMEGMPSYQTPNHFNIGVSSTAYNNEKPFTIRQEGTRGDLSRGLAALAGRGHLAGGSIGNSKKVPQKT